LNSRCTSAIVRPLVLSAASAANRAVTVVPMFAPSVIGNATSRLRMPAPISGTSSDVVTLLDCTETVIRMPTPMPMSPLRPSARFSDCSNRPAKRLRIVFVMVMSEAMVKELRRICELADARHKDEELDVKMFT